MEELIKQIQELGAVVSATQVYEGQTVGDLAGVVPAKLDELSKGFAASAVQGLGTLSQEAPPFDTAKAKEAVEQAREEARERLKQVHEHTEVVIDALKAGVHVAAEYPNALMWAAVGGLVLVVPFTRRALWRQTFGRLRSEEGAFKAAERRFGDLRETLAGQEKEVEKLTERAAAATAELTSGQRKLQAAGAEIKALLSRAERQEYKLQLLAADLRLLPSKQALATRGEVAKAEAEARKQRQALEKEVRKAIHHVYL